MKWHIRIGRLNHYEYGHVACSVSYESLLVEIVDAELVGRADAYGRVKMDDGSGRTLLDAFDFDFAE